jgi:hypothetical protein
MISTFIIRNLFHLLIVGPLFLYIGINEKNISSFFYPILFYLGILIVFLHCYLGYLKISKGINPWVNVIHILFIGPILIYIGYYKSKTPNYFYQLMLLLGFAVIGYHGYYLIKDYSH